MDTGNLTFCQKDTLYVVRPKNQNNSCISKRYALSLSNALTLLICLRYESKSVSYLKSTSMSHELILIST